MAVSFSQSGHSGESRATALPRRPWVATTLRVFVNLGAFIILFQAYKMVRQTFAQRSAEVGTDNAERLIAWERRLHLFIEPNVQSWALSHEWLIRALNWNYFLFMPAFYTYCALGILFNPAAFRRLRRVFFFSMLLALPWCAIFPLAPPRFMTDHGLIDTLQRFGPVADTGGGMVAANQYAAMPSMHIGWTTIGACMVAAVIPTRKLGRAVAGSIVGWMCLTVMATGNHYVFDVLGGWTIVATAFVLARLSERVRPVEASAPAFATKRSGAGAH